MIHSNYHSVILLGSVFRWTVKDALRGNTCFIISSPALFLSLGFKHSFPTTPFTIYIYHWPHHRVSKSFSGAVLPPSVMVSFGSFTEVLHYCRRWTIRVWVRLGQRGSKRKSANLSLNLMLCFWWRPQEKWFHRAATLHNVYIVQFFSSRPNEVRHILKSHNCHTFQHIFVPTRSVERKMEQTNKLTN